MNILTKNEAFHEFLGKSIIPNLKTYNPNKLGKFQPLTHFKQLNNNITIDKLHENIEKSINHNCIGGKCFRANLLVKTFTECISTNKNVKLDMPLINFVFSCAWAIEFLQASFLVADDIMDKSLTRRGKPCWYKVAGMTALNDALILESLCFRIIRNFHDLLPKPLHNNQAIQQLFLDISETTKYGQELDIESEKETDIQNFTSERYNTIITLKTAYYTIYLPVCAGVLLAINEENLSKKNVENLTSVCLKLGRLFQIQDDYLDVYGDPKITGKIGTDIQDKKCSWLIVQALNKATNQDLKILKENYGYDNQDSVKIVKETFQKLQIKQEYMKYQASESEKLKIEIENLNEKMPKSTLFGFLNVLVGRNK